MSQTLTCPKCQSEMRSYERNRVLVDQCTGCGGIFLDKGELEALSAAENAWHQPEQAAAAATQPPQSAPPGQGQGYAQPYPPAQQYASSRQRYAQGYPQGGYYKGSKQRPGYGHSRRGSFLGDLFG